MVEILDNSDGLSTDCVFDGFVGVGILRYCLEAHRGKLLDTRYI